MCDRRPLHRRRGRGGIGGGKISQGRRRRVATVTPCWCYGSETMDMDASVPKAIWGFNGTERPGAVYLAAVRRRPHPEGVAGVHDLRTRRAEHRRHGDSRRRARENFELRQGRPRRRHDARQILSVHRRRLDGHRRLDCEPGFVRGLLRHAGRMRGHDRTGSPDRGKNLRRRGIQTRDGLGEEKLSAKARITTRTRAPRKRKDWEWEFVVKSAMIVRDLMIGNPRLARLGFGEEALGHNAILSGFQGQRHWTDHYPNGDFLEAMLNSSFDWNGIREPFLVATENDSPERPGHVAAAIC